MGKVIIINASPRAPRSNSRQYSKLFSEYFRLDTEYFEVRKSNHLALCHMIENCSDIIFVFPLYVDSIPVTLLNFLKTLEKNMPFKRPTISVVINCGFIEPYQNDIAVKMLQLFANKNGFPFGSVFKIGSGEAILTTPFRIFLKLKMKKFAVSIKKQKYDNFQVTMPISKKTFIKASTAYWVNYGKKNGISKEQMEIMEIECDCMSLSNRPGRR